MLAESAKNYNNMCRKKQCLATDNKQSDITLKLIQTSYQLTINKNK